MDHVQQTPLSGNLKQYMLPEVFLKAVLQQFSGALEIQSDQLTKMIYFKSGNVVYVESNIREETFGYFLMRKKKIDPKTLNEALQELANQKDLKLGEILLKKGVIDPNSLMEMLNTHQEEKLSNTFEIKTGSYLLVPNTEWPSYVTAFPFRTLSVFFTSIEKNITQAEIEEYTGIYSQALVQIKFQPDRDIPLPPFATRLLNSLTRTLVSVEELSKKMSVPVEKVCTFLFIFKLAQWIHVERVPRKKQVETEAKATVLPPEVRTDSHEQIVEKKDINPLLIQRMEIEYNTLQGMNFYQIFNLNHEFKIQQIQVKFFQVISEFKKYESLPKGIEMIQWVKTAYDVLRDEKLRSIYDRRFAFRKKDLQVELAEKNFYRALRMIEKNELEPAEQLLDEINKKAKDSTFQSYKAWVHFKRNPAQNVTASQAMVTQAFATYAADPFAHFIAGQLYQYKKNIKKAEEHYRSAIQVYPTFVEATNALDAIRVEKTKEKRVEEKAKKEKEKNPGFFDLNIAGITFGKKD